MSRFRTLFALFAAACVTGEPGPSGQQGDDVAWAATFGAAASDEAWGLAALDDGGVVLGTHQSAPNPTPEAYIYRLASDGSVSWETPWTGRGWEKVFPVVVDGDLVYVGGTSYATLDNATADAFLLALDLATGAVLYQWMAETDGYEEIDAIVPDGEHLYVSGWQTGEATTNDVLVASFTRELVPEWTAGYRGDGWDEANGGMAKVGDHLFVTGVRGGTGMYAGGEAMVASYAATDGAEEWVETWTTDGFADGLGLACDGERLFTVSMEQHGADGVEAGIRSFTLDGEPDLVTTWGGAGTQAGRAIVVDPSDGLLVLAVNTDAAGTPDVAVLRLDPTTGATLAEADWSAAGQEHAHEVAVGPDAVFVAGDTTSIGAGQTDGLLLRLPLDLGSAPPVE